MIERKNALIAACLIIAICICTITALTYSLFTDSVSIRNHLKAGSLDITLTRTDLEYCILGDDGLLHVVSVPDDHDFTGSTEENAFGINSKNLRIVPGCYFDTTMQVRNNGNISCIYSIGVELIGERNAFTDQLQVTVTHPDGSKTVRSLSELAAGNQISTGVTVSSATVQNFKVRVEFIDDTGYVGESDIANDDAKGLSAVFDLVITATQATNAGN